MKCANHPEVDVQSYCQNCGKPLCAGCVRTTPNGQILCENCVATAGNDPSQAYWQAFVTPPRGVPNPAAAAVLGLIPGVGAMYNGQLFKGLIHVVIFAVLISLTENYPVFGIFIGAWVLYQSFEAFHTAKARRDGTPLPDPFGFNEVGNWLNLGNMGRGPGVPPMPPPVGYEPPQGPAGSTVPPPYTATYTSSWSDPAGQSDQTGQTGQATQQPPYAEPYAGQYTPPYAETYQNYPPGYVPPMPPIPPVPPVPPFSWRRREPVWAVVLIVLGVIFLLKSLGFVGHIFHFAWPVLLIGLGVWLIISRVGYAKGGSK